jgi:ABC-type phosphate transport system permease subunit
VKEEGVDVGYIAKTLLSTCIALCVSLFFIGYEQSSTFTGSLEYGANFIINTLHGRMIYENFYGLRYAQISLTVRLIIFAILFSIVLGVSIAMMRVRGPRSLRTVVSFVVGIVESIPVVGCMYGSLEK